MSRIEKSPGLHVTKNPTYCAWCEWEVGERDGLCKRCYEDYRDDWRYRQIMSRSLRALAKAWHIR